VPFQRLGGLLDDDLRRRHGAEHDARIGARAAGVQGHVDGAADDRAGNGVVAGQMPPDTADDGALDAARGVGLEGVLDDGTIAPTAALGSLPFAPEIVIPAAREMRERFGASIYSTYGFRDAFNPSVTSDPAQPASAGDAGWVDRNYIGIDEGPILTMIENYRSGLVWRVMRDNLYIRRGLERAGFSGGWLTPPGASAKGEMR